MSVSAENIAWIEEHCHVPEGEHVGQQLIVHKPHREIIKGIYDSPTRLAIVSVARKNAKTTLAACLLLLHLCGPRALRNSQLYSTALSRKQAALIFDLAAKMVRMSADLSAFIVVRDSSKTLFCPEIGTTFQALAADAPTSHGLSPVFCIHDELGQVRGPRSDLYDALETASGAHRAPLSIVISTQAPTDGDLLSVLIDDAKTGKDPRRKLFLWTAPPEDNPFLLKTWKKANPMLGLTLSVDSVRDMAQAAKRMPSREAAFRNLMLNQRIDSTSSLITQAIWQKNKGDPDLEVLENAEIVFGGLDLSSRNDLTALVYMAIDEKRFWHVWCEFFAPEVGVMERAQRDRAPYDLWARQGWITLCPGASVDYEIVAQRLVEVCDHCSMTAIAFDRWRMDVLKKELERLNVELPLVPHGQGFRDMSPAVDGLEAALVNGKVLHGSNPALTWCIANMKASEDAAGNRKPDKKKSTGRIDGGVALTMAFGAAGTATGDTVEKSRYETEGEGLLTL